ncbi:hypothetical protein MMC14_010324 [Varicellaria rhodocarpa]|nr:hypothetical protein [Varicellaria rhodocarpa]
MAPSAAFNQAATAVMDYRDNTPTDTKLEFYGLYKQALQSPPIEETTRPSAFTFEAKYKWDSWKKIVEDGVTPAQAEKKYIELYKATHAEYTDPEKRAKRLKK